jgi:hypothetical protein
MVNAKLRWYEGHDEATHMDEMARTSKRTCDGVGSHLNVMQNPHQMTVARCGLGHKAATLTRK